MAGTSAHATARDKSSNTGTADPRAGPLTQSYRARFKAEMPGSMRCHQKAMRRSGERKVLPGDAEGSVGPRVQEVRGS